MENQNRNLLIIVIVVIIALCCCVAAVAAVAAGWLANTSVKTFSDWDLESGTWEMGRVSDESEFALEVGQAPNLEVENFAGNVTILAEESNTIRVNVTKYAPNSNALSRITVDWDQQGDRVQIRSDRPSGPVSNMSVQFEIVVPAGTVLQVNSGAGEVRIEDVLGEIDAHTGAGRIEVVGSRGQVRLDTGAGELDYQGDPQGICRFETGAGSITLRLPANLNAELDLGTGIGRVDLGGFDVVGDVSPGEVDGTVGTGQDAQIQARSGAGEINLVRR